MKTTYTGQGYVKRRGNARITATRVKSAHATLCQVTGHDWQKTASDKVQVCTRKYCKEVKQLINGHWRYVTRLDSHANLEANAVKAVETYNQMALIRWSED